ncbi:ABC transporter substrate-binding protein [Cumulibacter soli]|uniref:ABC transporter substrate-binding protein n=1 Tax=Cumulibacter soli TaxID=2546344 RepID=UPI00106851F5|nr:ABC transporter substrate-binding protein [Cumulibacter soli]
MPELRGRLLTRRRALVLGSRVAAAGVVGGLAGYGAWNAVAPALAGSSKRAIRIGYLPVTDAAALLTAYDGGFLAKQGIDAPEPVLFRSWESLAQAFAIGEVDAVHLLMPLAIQLKLAKKTPLKVIAWGHVNGSALTVSNDIGDLSQLAGTTVAIPYWWSVHNILLQRMFAAEGLTPVIRQQPSVSEGTVQLAVMAPADMVAALAGGTVGGYVVADPFSVVAEKQGIGRVERFLGDVWKEHACCAIVVREELINEDPDVVQGLTTAIVQAQQWIDENRPQMGALLTEGGYLPQPTPAVGEVFTRDAAAYADVTTHEQWHGERLGFSAFPMASYTEALVEQMRTTTIDGDTAFLDDADGDAVHGGLVDDRFARAALGGDALPSGKTDRQELIEP